MTTYTAFSGLSVVIRPALATLRLLNAMGDR